MTLTSERADQIEPRRERNKRLKREAILAAAAELFAEHGYDAVTTQQIAEHADVSNGTFFRYARTKADLLVELMTERVVRGREEGIALAHAGADPSECVIALLIPLGEISQKRPEVGLAYQRELLFTAQDDRSAALDQVEELQEAVEDILRITRGEGRSDHEIQFAARAIYSTVYIDLVRFAGGREPADGLTKRLAAHIDRLVAGLLP